jgi:hypothetical protein
MPPHDHNPKGWTFAAFETYVEASINALKEATGIAMAASEKAITKAETADDKRFSLLNEFRATTNDQQKNFANKEQTEFRLNAIDKEVNELKISKGVDKGKGQGIWFVVAGIAWFITTAIAVFAIFLHRG